MAPRCKVNIESIAREIGVSKVTVSKALNDKDGVSESLRERIKTRANELGYHMNYLAKGLKNNRTFNVGLLVAERYIKTPSNYYFEVETRLVQKLKEYGYTTILEVLDSIDEDEGNLPSMYLSGKIDGLIIVGECQKEYLSQFENFPIPVLFFDFYFEDLNIDGLITDNFKSGFDATSLLIKNGHKDIAFIGNIYSTSSIKNRFLGYYKALLDSNIQINYDYVISDRDEKGKLIEINLPQNLPTSFVCNNDELAYNLVNKLKKLGKKVPGDVSIVTFDNTIYSTLGEVKLTTCDSNVDQMIEKAAKAIAKKIEDTNKKYGCILVNGKIIERDSVKNLIN